ncbi:expressed unknown protein [Seminavis robusta]|uniref:SET domain-containing protein n=1 Tax=Seminavis robusta TaxID=568900 RepID=A0A9N8ES51_9STRA|nr:expressed unknown protein [Seminavis robusta]|eukprot:Sro1496_g277480.1 n/a (485) ;mRNA; r:3801-5348
MKKGRRGSRKQEKKSRDVEDEPPKPRTKGGSAGVSRDQVLAAATVVGIAYLALPLIFGGNEMGKPLRLDNTPKFDTDNFAKSNALTVEERLLEEWYTGGGVTIEVGKEGHRGLVATRDIQHGQVITSVRYPDLEQELNREYPTLRTRVEKFLNTAKREMHGQTTLTTAKVMSLLKLLMEESKGEDSFLSSFIESLPKNLTDIAWYWSDTERLCVVPRPDSESLHHDLNVYHRVMEQVKSNFEPLQEIYSKEKVEWAYLMLKTRGFSQFFLPLLHLANHNALKAVPAFLIPSSGMAAYVATQNIKAGDPVYTSYGTMTPVVTAEQYGFVESEEDATYFEVPSIHEEILQSERTKDEPLCTQEPVRFFGDITTQRVGTKFKSAGHSTFFKAFMPDERSYACIRVLLQTERDTDVARYISEKLAVDLEKYRSMASAPHCQSAEGNMPLIRKANQVTAKLMEGALKVAEDGRDWKIAYPDIPSYIMNN